jgi:hypothetical protein
MAEGKSSPGRASNRAGSSTRRGLVNGNGLTNGLTNGLGRTNGRGRTNGLVNGLGRVNGTGRTNGLTNGIVNGNGLVNGRGLVNGTKRSLRTNAFGVVTHRDIKVGVSLTLLFILLLPSFYLLMSTPTPRLAAVQIDGVFGDWNAVPKYIEDNGGAVDDIAFTEYALVEDSNTLFIYFQVRGQVFAETQGYDGFYAFIDTDGNPATGYWPGDLGAEYAIKINGIGGKVTNSDFMKFESTGDRLNWTAWKSAAYASAAASSSSVELAVNMLAADLETTYIVRLAGSDFEGHTTLASLRMGSEYGALSVEQVPSSLMTVLNPSSNEILRLKMHAQGKKVVIEDFAASATWQCYPPNLRDYLQLPNRVELEAGEQEDILVGVDLAGFASKSPMWLNLTGLDVDVPLTINGDGGVGYVNQAPQNKIVDGWFGDWLPPFQTDASPSIPNPNVDIAAYSSNTSHGTGYDKSVFYVEFLGKAMAGNAMPAKVMWAQAGQPSPPATPGPAKRVSGEDRLTIFIDTNSSDTRGCRAGTLTADFKLELVGHQRKVDSKILYSCSGAVWIQVPGAVLLAMTSGSKIEMSIDLSVLGTLDNPMMLVESTDWSGIGDLPPPIDMGTRSGERGGTRSADSPKVLHGNNAETVVSLALGSNPALDGKCGDLAYSAAGKVSKFNYEYYVGHWQYTVWICIRFYDRSNDAGDYADLMFDTLHDGTDFPQIDDRHYQLSSNSVTLTRQRGDGSGWTLCGAPCIPDAAQSTFDVANNSQVYEFKLVQSNVWDSTNTEGRAGFAIHLFNWTGSFNYYWGSTNVDINKPSTWGHLDIPEFPAILVPILIVVAVGRPWRKRRLA